MKYSLVCLLNKNVAQYRYKLAKKAGKKYKIRIAEESFIPTHFTLKYPFRTRLAKVERMLQAFSQSHMGQKIKIGGFNTFDGNVLFLEVKPSKKARSVFFDLLKELKKINGLSWYKYDGRGLHFHASLTLHAEGKAKEIIKYLRRDKKTYNSYLDNITILKRETKRSVWKVYRRYDLK